MKKIILVVLLGGLAWWVFEGGHRLSEEDVRGFYRQQEHATLTRSPEDLCALLDEQFEAVVPDESGNPVPGGILSKEQTCDGYRKMYRTFEVLGDKMGGMLQLDYRYTINDIQIAPDGKSAKVDVSYAMDVAGSLINIRNSSTDTLVRRVGKVVMLRSEGSPLAQQDKL